MRPSYQNRTEASVPFDKTIRIPGELFKKLELYAAREGDRGTGLVVEGMLRVIDDRESDPNFMAAVILARPEVAAELAESQPELLEGIERSLTARVEEIRRLRNQ